MQGQLLTNTIFSGVPHYNYSVMGPKASSLNAGLLAVTLHLARAGSRLSAGFQPNSHARHGCLSTCVHHRGPKHQSQSRRQTQLPEITYQDEMYEGEPPTLAMMRRSCTSRMPKRKARPPKVRQRLLRLLLGHNHSYKCDFRDPYNKDPTI